MNPMTKDVESTFLDAFWTILIQECRGSDLSIAQWARAAGVDLHSLKQFRDEVRPIQCSYGIRLCYGLQLSFARVLREAIQLNFKTPVGRRCAWRSQLLKDPSAIDKRPANEAEKIATYLCAGLARRIADSGRNFSELARQSGVDRTVISRLGQPGRQNPSLKSLFNLSCVIGCQLDVLAWEVSQPFEFAQKKEVYASRRSRPHLAPL